MTIQEIIGKTDAFVLKTYGRRPIAFETGEGITLYDTGGTAYLDFTSGLGVNALGYSHPTVTELITRQATKVLHTSNLYHIQSQAELAERLCGNSFGERIFFCNSGTEAVEGALKFARKWGKKFTVPKTEIIAFRNSFHGRTFGALSATMQAKYQKGFEPLVPEFKEAVFGDTESFDRLVNDKTAAVIVEPVQGEGGVNVSNPAFLQHIGKICGEHEILLIVDEVQCGMGRTGKLFAHEHFGITPDLMTLAKPLAGGLPIGAVVVGPRVWPEIKPGEHASTFGGNHFVSSLACGVFDIISDPAFLASVAARGEHMRKRLDEIAAKYNTVTEVRGIGLIWGVQVTFPASEAVDYFEKRHMLICPAGPNVIRFIPPLIVTDADLDKAVDTLDEFLAGRN